MQRASRYFSIVAQTQLARTERPADAVIRGAPPSNKRVYLLRLRRKKEPRKGKVKKKTMCCPKKSCVRVMELGIRMLGMDTDMDAVVDADMDAGASGTAPSAPHHAKPCLNECRPRPFATRRGQHTMSSEKLDAPASPHHQKNSLCPFVACRQRTSSANFFKDKNFEKIAKLKAFKIKGFSERFGASAETAPLKRRHYVKRNDNGKTTKQYGPLNVDVLSGT